MTGQQLKNSILQLAIQGKLVPQDPNDEPASVLLEKIRKEKEHMVKDGKLKKKDLETTPISDDEKPFEIPESWEWCRLGDLGIFERGNGIKRDETLAEGYPCVRYGEMYTKYRYSSTFDKTCSFTSKPVFDSCRKAHKGDLFMALTGENKQDIALAAQYIGDAEIAVGGDLCHFTILKAYSLYFVYLINSPYYSSKKEVLATGDIIVHISADKLGSISIPLPPLSEQQRIVAKIEELLPLVEEYDKAQKELDALNTSLPEALKKSILQEAIQGKLVPQDPNEEPASVLLEKIRKEKEQLVKDGKLKKKDLITTPISDDEKPFEIPESWEWCRLGNISTFNGGFAFKSHEYVAKGNGIRVLRISDFSEKGFIDKSPVYYPETDSCKNVLLEENDIVMCMTGGTVGKSYHVKKLFEPMYVNQRVADLKIKKQINCDYIYLNILAPYIQSVITENKNSTNDNISAELIKGFMIPLPPLAEQNRIVAKTEELFNAIDNLKVS